MLSTGNLDEQRVPRARSTFREAFFSGLDYTGPYPSGVALRFSASRRELTPRFGESRGVHTTRTISPSTLQGLPLPNTARDVELEADPPN